MLVQPVQSFLKRRAITAQLTKRRQLVKHGNTQMQKIVILLQMVHELSGDVDNLRESGNWSIIGLIHNRIDAAWKLAKIKAGELDLAITASIEHVEGSPYSSRIQRYSIIDMDGRIMDHVDGTDAI